MNSMPPPARCRGRGLLPNPDGLLQPGLFGRCGCPERLHTVVLVPDEVIQFDQSRQFVFVINPDGVVERRWITVSADRRGHAHRARGLDGSVSQWSPAVFTAYRAPARR